jgi:hypothetical protein
VARQSVAVIRFALPRVSPRAFDPASVVFAAFGA